MIAVRPAREADRAVIAEISKHYDSNLIHLVHKTWQQQGAMYIAEREGKEVGFCGLSFPAPTEAQILGLRLLPEFQKEQAGRDFIIALMQVAQEKGCNVVRLITASENYETQAALQRNLNFTRCGAWVIGYGEELADLSGEENTLAPAGPEQLEEIWSFLQYSQVYRRNQGLIYTDFYSFRSFSKAFLSQLLSAGAVYTWPEGGELTGVSVAQAVGDSMVISYLDGKPRALPKLLRGIVRRSPGHLTAAMAADIYADARPYLEEILVQHQPDHWLVMAKEVSPLAAPRE